MTPQVLEGLSYFDLAKKAGTDEKLRTPEIVKNH
jgi:hypothetical protein